MASGEGPLMTRAIKPQALTVTTEQRSIDVSTSSYRYNSHRIMVSNGMYKPIKPNSLITSSKGENKHIGDRLHWT